MKSLKTAISIPEDIYRDAEDVAKRLGMSRSRLYSAAVADFLNRYRKDDIKTKLNEVYSCESPGVDPVLAAMQIASLPHAFSPNGSGICPAPFTKRWKPASN